MHSVRFLLILFALLAAALGPDRAWAQQEMLQNRSFETPNSTILGNNFFRDDQLPSWDVLQVSDSSAPTPVNLIRPHAGYVGGPTVVAPGDTGGVNYFDVNSMSGVIGQTVTMPAAGTVSFSGWFSTRDGVRSLTGLTLRLRRISTNAIVAQQSVAFSTTDALYSWKQATVADVAVEAATYRLEVVLPNEANFDLASLVFTPRLVVTKTRAAVSDPVNGTTNPKAIPGGVVDYTITATTRPGVTVTSNSIVLVDPTPAGLDLVVADAAACNRGTTALTCAYGGPASTTDQFEFSTNGGTTWTASPTDTGGGVDNRITHVRVRPTGSMAASTSFSVRLRYRVE